MRDINRVTPQALICAFSALSKFTHFFKIADSIGVVRQNIKEVARLGIDNLLNLGQLLLSVSYHDVNILLIN